MYDNTNLKLKPRCKYSGILEGCGVSFVEGSNRATAQHAPIPTAITVLKLFAGSVLQVKNITQSVY